MTPFLVSDKWYDLRDLSNLSSLILESVDKVLPFGFAYVLAALIGFVGAFVLFVLPSQLFLGVYGERKIIGRMQSRLGPNRVGPYGLLQPIADAIKLLQKESLTPRAADRVIMLIAPVLFVMPAVLVFAVIPFGPNMVFADINVSLLYYMAISSLPVIAAFMSGWSHNNKYSLYGAMRIVAMAISYEVSLVMAILGVVLFTSSLSLQGIVLWQADLDIWLIALQPLGFVIYFIAVSAELNRTPTDIAEAESEIVAGYLTEYSGMKWGLFYGMDIGYALAAAAFGATLFLGGWSVFGLEEYVPAWLLFIAKVYGFYFLFIWTRGTLPRLRLDQLMAFAWKFMLPLALVNLLIVAAQRLVWRNADFEQGLLYVFAVVNIGAAVLLVYLWAKLLGYRPNKSLEKPRLVNQAGGYIPVEPTRGGGR